MKNFINILDFVVSKFWLLFCTIIFVVALAIKAQYNFNDSPYFSQTTVLDITLLILFLMTYILIITNAEKIEAKFKTWTLWLTFGTLGILFVFLVPIKPFSDMSYVTDGALLFADLDIDGIMASDYLQMITKNLKVSFFYGILTILLPKNVFSLRLVNVVFYLLISHFLGKISKNLGFKYPKVIFIISASYIPLFLYCNHIYFDLPTLLMCILAFYFYTKEHNLKNILLSSIFLGVGCCLRVLAYLVFVALFIDFLFKHRKELFVRGLKKIGIIITFAIITLGIPKICDTTVNTFFRVENAQSETIWNLFCMGINEYEFGFMHNEIATAENKSFNDFYELLVSRNTKQNVKLFGRKIFWTWSQGTYQAQRYAFGPEVQSELEKFEYETPVTGFLMSDNFILRQFINMLCRAQYLALFLLMIIGLIKLNAEDKNKYRPFIYLMFGTFLILIFYEMKSRYVMHCFVPMLLLAIRGVQNINDYRKNQDAQ